MIEQLSNPIHLLYPPIVAAKRSTGRDGRRDRTQFDNFSTSPIESTFATVRLGTVKTTGCLSRKTAPAMVFKVLLSARRKWRGLDGSDHLVEVIQGVMFKDGIEQIQNAA